MLKLKQRINYYVKLINYTKNELKTQKEEINMIKKTFKI